MRRVFKDNTFNKKLQDEGYVVVPLLREEQIRLLLDFYAGIAERHKGFTTYAVQDYTLRKEVDGAIKAQLSVIAKTLFDGYELYWGNIFVKESGSPPIPLHADLQYAEEPEEISLNIWCPLQDVNEANGALGIVPYSHHAMRQIRGTNITNAYRTNNSKIQEQFGVLLNLKAGEAIIYDHRLLHYSVSNTTSQRRLAITSVITRKEAKKIHYYAESENSTQFEKYVIPDIDVLLKTAFGSRPYQLQPVEHISDYRFEPLDTASVRKAMPGGILRQVVTLFKTMFKNA